MKYKLVVAGGTFDHFHAGHEAFLRGALASSERILLGITSDEYVREHKRGNNIQPYEERQKWLLEFLRLEGAAERVEIAPIDSALYPSQWKDLLIEAIIATKDTLEGARAINKSRAGMPPLDIIITDTLAGESGEKISSTAIRAGRIDTRGNYYYPEVLLNCDLLLPDSQRQRFGCPFGELFASIQDIPPHDSNRLVTVGDEVTRNSNELGRRQKLSVVDYLVQRHKRYKSNQELGFNGTETVLRASNPASQLTASLAQAITQAAELLDEPRRVIIRVDGEEDLTVLPLVLMLPLGYVILYGQPNEGVVRLEVTPATKHQAAEHLAAFVEA